MTAARPVEPATAPRICTVPTLADRVSELEELVAALQEKIAVLEAAQAVTDDLSADGRPRLGRFMRLKAAARASQYSESGLRKLVRQGRCIADYSGPHLMINVDSIPRRSVRVQEV